MKRIEFLRQVALNRKHTSDENELLYLFTKNYDVNEPSEYKQYADAFYAAFSQLTPSITSGELIVGEMEYALSAEQKEEFQNVYFPILKDLRFHEGPGQDSHMTVDYDLLLSEGALGVISRIENYQKTATPEQQDFYYAAKRCLEAMICHSENYSKYAKMLAEQETDDTRRAELLEISRICKKVPANPAESFYEAIQSVHFLTYCLSYNPFRGHQQFQLGHPDRYLYPYYKNDLERGVITKEKAQLLLDCLAIQINMRVPSGLSSGYMVGGRDENGSLVANELTEMLMQVVDDVRLVYPAVGLCYTSDMPKQYVKKACEVLSHGRSHPAIFNDDVISKGLQSYGVSEAESHSYIHSTCVEITPVASSNVWVASPYTNMAQLLLDTMTREYDTFDRHVDALLELLDASIKKEFNYQHQFRQTRATNARNPLLACFVNDCLSRGLDHERGGSRYNWIMPSFVGMANLVDSLYALKTVVYDEKSLTVCEFKKILDANFEGHEELRMRLLNQLPKYGNDIDEIDRYFGFFTDHIVEECKKYTSIHSNGKLIPSVFCWIMHEQFGRHTGATPDGRLAEFPLGDGSGPCQGRELKGPTASILSSTKWDHHPLIGGVAVNMKFSKSSLGTDSLAVMQALIEAFMQRGGFEMQINVTDKAVLEEARKNPEMYRDLVVRIGGYSDYFTRLSPQMQEEVILRTEHKI